MPKKRAEKEGRKKDSEGKEEPKKKSGEREGRKFRIKKNHLYTIVVVVGALILAGVLIYFKSLNAGSSNGVSEQLAKCIGQHSHVYTQLGCSHCAVQEALFGDSWKYMNDTDCYYTPKACSVIVQNGYYSTPTWIINNNTYKGIQTVDTLKNLTGC